MTGGGAPSTEFDWDDVLAGFDWDAPDELNLAHETVTRHVGRGPALHWMGEDGRVETFTYRDLEERSARVANALADLGVERGDPVATLVPRIPELYPTFLGIWRLGAVYVPLFTAFGPRAIETRVGDAGVRTVVTTPEYRDRIAAVEPSVGVERVLVIGEDVDGDDVDFRAIVDDQPTDHETARTGADDLCTLEYTSGTTGPPKGCRLTHRVLAALVPYLEYSLDLGDEVIWGAADPGWMYGLLTAGVAPVSAGVPNVIYEGEFDPERWYAVLERFEVTTLATSPTAYRGLMAAGDRYESFDLALRKGASAGEPLNPEAIRWFDEALGVTVHDHYGVTECGMVAGNHHAWEMPVKPGSMGLPLPGFDVRVFTDGTEADDEEVGELVVRRGPGTYFDGYWGRDDANPWITAEGAEWFATGDAAYRDADGYLWFVGRADDVIISSGYRIGPFEVESTLVEHPDVAEAAVVGVPDERRGEVVKAVLVPRAGARIDADELRAFVRDRLARHAHPRVFEVVDELPKTASGKIRRRELRGD
ncbi:acyl-CoA synthetase [Halomarina halobia]|uniref:Acyl-CoA synthetase n=1 Tax=Halomarina halobia TaxID=3033386 RepID=A0ABD6ABM7_9EURY|nr:AMP-binding protein [Halomarina sp. PSR21]